nr:hypothetical protein [Tanacetum cinerariifolium]
MYHRLNKSVSLPSNIKDHSFSFNSKIELFLFNSNNCISSVKKGSSQDEKNFAVFFHFENNEIGRKGLRVSRDSFAYKEYRIRLMLASRSAKALQEKVLLKLHGIRKLPGSPSLGETLFWIIVELSSLKKVAEICSILYSSDHVEEFFHIELIFFLSLGVEAKHRLEIHFHVEKRLEFLQRVGQKELGEKSANESGSKFILCFDSSFTEFVQPYSEELVNACMRIGFGSTIKLIFFDESQVVTFNGKFVCGFRNSDHETESQSDNTVGNPHGFIIHWIIILKNIKKVTEVIDVENWWIDNSQLLRLNELKMMVLVRQTENCDMLLHMVMTDMKLLVVEIETADITADDVKKVSCSTNVERSKQVDLKFAHSSIELHLHDIHVDQDKHEVDRRWMRVVFWGVNISWTLVSVGKNVNISGVKENQEKDKIGSKPDENGKRDKNGKRVEAGKSLKQL